jgi:hypothetical protein
MAAAMTERARPMLAPAAAYEILDIAEVRHERLVISPRVSLTSPRLAQALGGAKQMAVAVCTIGPQLEQAVGALFAAGQAVEATVLDGVGSAAVEELSQRTCRMFESIALTDTYLMRPLKSLSLVVGMGENLSVGGSPCEFCSLNQVCRYRERKA